ncbi:MAG: hypothetical protein ACK4FB_12915 [Brevundimonas sp.]|uniref:hypothetical protein n=1 Tax=Brevundimonas sp. TaxID=1871086 RepID=UPI003919059E
MSWFKKLFGATDDNGQQHMTEPATSFVYVRMPGDAQPTERHYLFEDPIEEQLKIRNLGYISGGGSLQSAPDENGVRRIELTGIDIEAEDLDAVRALLRNLLPGLGAPVGTQIEFTLEDQRLQDRLIDSGWIEREPRTDRHPGFDL